MTINRRSVLVNASSLGLVGAFAVIATPEASGATLNLPKKVGSVSSSPWTQTGVVTTDDQGREIYVCMPMSMGGIVNATVLVGPNYASSSYNIFARDAFADDFERAAQSICVLPDQNVLIGTTRQELVLFNPNTLTLKTFNPPAGTCSMVHDLSVDGGRVYVATRSGTYPNGVGNVLSAAYSAGSLTGWKTHTAAEHDQKAVVGIGAWKGTIFYGTGNTRAVLVQLNPNGTKKVLEDPLPAGGVNDKFEQVSVIGNYLFASYNGSNTSRRWLTRIYSLSTVNGVVQAKFLKDITGWEVARGRASNKVLTRGSWNSVWEHTLDATTPSVRLHSQASGQVLPSCPPLKNGNIVTSGSQGDLIIVNPTANTATPVLARYGAKTLVHSGRRRVSFIVSNTSTTRMFAASSYFSPVFTTLNATGTSLSHVSVDRNTNLAPQVERMVAVDDYMVYATYPNGGNFYQMRSDGSQVTDPSTAFAKTPRLANLNRPGAAASIGGGLAVFGVYGAPGSPTGGVYIWDTRSARVVKSRMLPYTGHGIGGFVNTPLSRTGGWVYGWTNVAMPDNPWSTSLTARLFRWKPATDTWQYLNLSTRNLGDAAFGKDGFLYTLIGSALKVYSVPVSGAMSELTDRRQAFGKQWEAPGGGITPLDDGRLILSAGGGSSYNGELWSFHPKTRVSRSFNTNGSKVTIPKGSRTMFFARSSDLMSLFDAGIADMYVSTDLSPTTSRTYAGIA